MSMFMNGFKCVHTCVYAACEPVCLCVHVHVLCKDREGGRESRALNENRAPYTHPNSSWSQHSDGGWLGFSSGSRVRGTGMLGAGSHQACGFCGEKPRGDSLEHIHSW